MKCEIQETECNGVPRNTKHDQNKEKEKKTAFT